MANQVNKNMMKATGIIILTVLFWLALFMLEHQDLTGSVTGTPAWIGSNEFKIAGQFRLNLDEHLQAGNKTLTYYTSNPDNLSVMVQNSELVVQPEKGFAGEREIIIYVSDNGTISEQAIVIAVQKPRFSVGPPAETAQNKTNQTPAPTEPANKTETGLKIGPDNLLKKGNKYIGRRVADSPMEIFFDSIELSNNTLILEFRHNSSQTENILVEAENFTLNKTQLAPGEKTILKIPLVQGIIPKFNLKVGVQSGFAVEAQYKEVLEIGKTIPQINSNAQKRLIDRNDEKLDLELNKNSSRALIRGLNTSQITANFGQAQKPEIKTQVIATGTIPIEQATLTLAKTGPVNTIVECANISLQNMTCQGQWQPANIPFTQNKTHITFTIDHFSGYAGADLEIINVQSYPQVGKNWTVAFNTTGTANLTITAIENTTWTDFSENSSLYDLKFLELKCNSTVLNYTWLNNSVFYPDYTCNTTGSEISKVLTTGKHALKFQFGDDVDYAYNLASANLTCAVRQTNCNAGEVGVMRMSNTSNAHAELINGTDYDYLVCCKDNDNRNNLTNSSGTNIVNLSSATDAHAEVPGTTDYPYGVYLGAEPDNITCTYDEVSGSCSGNKTCLFTMSNTTDAHVADCTSDPYSLTVCCEFQINNRAPNTTQVILNSSLGTNYTNEDLTCYAQGSDPDNDTLTIYYKWYKNNVEQASLSGSTGGVTPNTMTLISTLGSGNTTKGETWTCSVKANDGTVNETDWNNASLTVKNTLPTAPTLLIPLNNDTIIIPSPEFIWNNSIDADNDTKTYQILVDDSPAFDAPEINTTNIAEGSTNTSYNASVELILDKVYYWKVRANDSSGYGSFSTVFNFTLQSQLAINLVRDLVNFTNFYPNQTNDTSDNNPLPFLVENTGNVFANITVTGTKFFNYGGFPSNYYMFKISINESNAFDYSQSTTVYTNMTNVSSRKDIVGLDWHNANDTAEIDINITAPLGEPQGIKTSNVTLSAT